jgi:hypothetical protein
MTREAMRQAAIADREREIRERCERATKAKRTIMLRSDEVMPLLSELARLRAELEMARKPIVLSEDQLADLAQRWRFRLSVSDTGFFAAEVVAAINQGRTGA